MSGLEKSLIVPDVSEQCGQISVIIDFVRFVIQCLQRLSWMETETAVSSRCRIVTALIGIWWVFPIRKEAVDVTQKLWNWHPGTDLSVWIQPVQNVPVSDIGLCPVEQWQFAAPLGPLAPVLSADYLIKVAGVNAEFSQSLSVDDHQVGSWTFFITSWDSMPSSSFLTLSLKVAGTFLGEWITGSASLSMLMW